MPDTTTNTTTTTTTNTTTTSMTTTTTTETDTVEKFRNAWKLLDQYETIQKLTQQTTQQPTH